MSTTSEPRRAVAEINFGEGQGTRFKIGNRSIHQFWHLFSAHFRHVFLASQRRPDSGKTAWTWREAGENRPVTALELADVRRRLADANRSLGGGRDDDEPGAGASSLEGQVRASVSEMVDELISRRDIDLTAFVCRTEAGLMLHSWGASSAAEPHYPDAKNGEISGTVFVGAEPTPALNVVLENAQGTGLARVKSDSNGHFRFPNIAPGHYRLRVADRSDFPARGLEVEMEHESISDLELRSTEEGVASPSGTAAAATSDGASPWYKRRVIGVLVLLLILGIGSCAWRASRPEVAPRVAQAKSMEWQSAKGQLATSDEKVSSVGDRKAEAERQRSTFSPSGNGKKSKPTALPLEEDDGAEDRTRSGSRDSGQKDLSKTPGSGAAPNLPNKQKLPDTKSARQKSDERAAPIAVKPVENAPAPEASAAEKSKTEKSKAAGKKTANASPAAPTKGPSAAPEKSDEAVEESPAEAAPLAGADAPSGAAAATGNTSQSGKATKPKSVAGSSAAPAAPATEGPAEAGAPNPSASAGATAAAGASSGDQAKSSQGKSSSQGGSAAAAGATTAAPAATPEAAAATEAPPDAPASPAAAAKPTPKLDAVKKAGASPAPPDEKPEENPEPENSAATPAPASTPPTTAAKKSPKSAAPSGSNAASAAGAASSAEPETDSDATPQSTDAPGKGPTPAKKNPPAKKTAPTASAPTADQRAPAAESAALLPVLGPTAWRTVNQDAPLVKIGQVRASTWKARLFQDQILPTRPMTAAEEESVDAMREKILQSRRAAIPPTFQQPQVQSGFVLELPPTADAGNSPLRWRDEAGGEASGATVQGNRAELAWSGNASPRNRGYVLSDPAGQEFARVNFDAAGALVLKASPSVKARYWVGVEHAPQDGAAPSAAEAKPRFDWRLSSGESIPASWSRDDRWHAGRGQRLEIPLDVTSARVGNYGIALVDQPTGWALVCDVALQ